MWGSQLGALACDESSGVSTFEYSDEWIKKIGLSISPVHLPLTAGRKFNFPGLNPLTYRGLPGAFADTLPDDFGNAVINAWLSREGRSLESFTPLERLLYQGRRGMGALEYEPATKGISMKVSEKIKLDSLTNMAQEVLDQRAGYVEKIADEKEMALLNLMKVGTSAGGARPKAVIGLNADKTELRSGQVALPDGFDYYLIKFDGVTESHQSNEVFGDPKGYGRMEYAYYLMAMDCGIHMSECGLLEDESRAHFITKRFDRDGLEKNHVQTLNAMAHADYKKPGFYSYEELFALMRTLSLSKKEALEMVRRMVFNIVARNHDDHTKNFSFIMNKNGQWQLSPAYDIAYSYKPGSKWVDQHQLSLNGKRDNFSRSDILSAIPNTLQKEANDIIGHVVEVVSQWPQYSENAGVFPEFSKIIQKNHILNL